MKRTVLGVVVDGRDHAAEYRKRLEKDPNYFRNQDRAFIGGCVPRYLATALEQEKRVRGTTAVAILVEALRKELFKKR